METVLILTTLLIPTILAQCSIEKAKPLFKRSVYEFSMELVNRVAQENENHFVVSPLSPWALISTVSLGATDETLAEINQVLKLHPFKCFNNKYFDIIKDITSTSDGTVLERSSTLFADERMSLKEDFKNRLKKTQVSDIEELAFDNFVATAGIINDYVNRNTHGTIDEIISPNDLEGVYLVLIDALYFKGTWKSQFSLEETEVAAFYDGSGTGKQIGDVNLMFGQLNVKSKIIAPLQANVLELPYGSNSRFSMLFFLPEFGVSVTSVLNNFRRVSISSIFNLFAQTPEVLTLVQIPKFKINSDLDNMKELLIDMGLRTMFDANEAKFGEISDYSLYISNFIQKATIEVNEEGSEASAATSAMFSSRSARANEFTANRPFIYMIIDKQNEIPLFVGAYSNPSVY